MILCCNISFLRIHASTRKKHCERQTVAVFFVVVFVVLNYVAMESILNCLSQLIRFDWITRDGEVRPDRRIYTEGKRVLIQFAFWFVQGAFKWKGEKFR